MSIGWYVYVCMASQVQGDLYVLHKHDAILDDGITLNLICKIDIK